MRLPKAHCQKQNWSSGWFGGFLRTTAATVLYGVVHSLFASGSAKQIASTALGVRRRNALYRPFYLLQSAATMAVLVCYVRRQPEKFIVNARGLASVPFRACQVAGVCWAIAAAYEVGFSEILGVRPLVSLLRGADAILPEPEAQPLAP
ncbi:MAG: hypothetical protein ACJ746_01095 [Bryobacteraceae bacterium]